MKWNWIKIKIKNKFPINKTPKKLAITKIIKIIHKKKIKAIKLKLANKIY